MKRIICFLLTVVLLTSGVFSMNVSAQSGGGLNITEIQNLDPSLTSVEPSDVDTEEPIVDDNIITDPDTPSPVVDEPETPAVEEDIEIEIEEEEEDEFGADGNGYLDIELPHPGSAGPQVISEFSAAAMAAPPASWDGRGNMPPVRNQGQWGNCWAFSAIASAEAGLRRNYSTSYGTNTSNSISPYHLTRFFYNTPNDPLGNLAGNQTIPRINSNDIGVNDTRYLNIGGNNLFTTWSLAAGRGGSAEANAPYNTILATNGVLPNSLAYNNMVRLQNAFWIDLGNRTLVKQMVQSNGAVSMAYFDTGSNSGNYRKTGAGTAYYQTGSTSANHAVAIVGWNDNFSRSNFSTQPPGNGAWLVRNSWGSGWGDGGYFWLSYHDASISGFGKWGFVYRFEPSTNYRTVYQYDGSAGIRTHNIPPNGSVSSIFRTSGGAQRLDAVSVGVFNDNVNYNVQIYLNPPAGDPTSGTPMLSTPQAGSLPYVGYHTIKLKNPVTLPANSTFAVVITYPNGANQFVDTSYNNSNWIRFVNPSTVGRTFFRNTATGSWQDFARTNAYTARIKAFTNPTTSISVVNRNNREIFYDISVTNAQAFGNISRVTFEVWSETNGKDDLVRYNGTLSNGVWRGAADVRRHKGSGTYRVNIIGVTASGGNVSLGTATFNVTKPGGGSTTIRNSNPNAGTFDVHIAGINSPSSVNRVTVSVWTRANKSDLRKITATRLSDGSYRARVNVSNFGFRVGTYNAQAEIITGNGLRMTRTITHRVPSKPIPMIRTVNRNGGDTLYDINITNAQVAGNFKSVRLGVWSVANGKDDLVWYSATLKNGVWRGTADIRRHKDPGVYRINAWGVTASGKRVLLGTTTFNVTTPAGTAEIRNNNPSAGTFDVLIRGINSPSGVNQVMVSIWTKADRSDLRRVTATRLSDGSYRARIHASNHDFHAGTYNARAVITAGNRLVGSQNLTHDFTPAR